MDVGSAPPTSSPPGRHRQRHSHQQRPRTGQQEQQQQQEQHHHQHHHHTHQGGHHHHHHHKALALDLDLDAALAASSRLARSSSCSSPGSPRSPSSTSSCSSDDGDERNNIHRRDESHLHLHLHHLHHRRRHPSPRPRPAPKPSRPPPEVISSLITSLADVAPPPPTSFYDARLSTSTTPDASDAAATARPSPRHSSGSFGLDYGAYARPGLDPPVGDGPSLDGPSLDALSLDGLAASSPVVRTAKHPSGFSPLTAPRHDPGLRTLMRSSSTTASRPSSAASKNDDARSIGNLSIERASAPTPDLRSRRSLGRGLMAMASRERLDPPSANPNPIPSRDSSLRTPAARRRRPSPRHSSHEAWGDAILEHDEPSRPRTHDAALEPDMADRSFLLELDDDFPAPPVARPSRPRARPKDRPPVDADDSAPYPSVSSGRRRAEHGPEPNDAGPVPRDVVKPKRSGSRLKRLSAAPLSPRADSRLGAASPDFSHAASPPPGSERPGSADSVDDAVEAYLCSPRLSQKIRHPQTGRVISFSEVGDANGSAVFCCVGMGLTRYITAFYDELALTLKLRLITPDRPGVGDSDPYSDGTATPLSWPDDVYAICQALKITKFSILAHSAGAIYALATALRMPQHIRGRIHLLAPWIPPSQMNVFGSTQAMPPTNAIPTSQKILRALPTPILKAANSSFMTATSSSITSSLPKNQRRAKRKVSNTRDLAPTPGRAATTPVLDADSLAYANDAVPTHNMDRMQPPRGTATLGDVVGAAASAGLAPVADRERQATYDTRLTHAIWELATTGANPAVDLLVCLERRHNIGFRYVDITRPVVIHHGSRDSRVPVDNVKWLGKTMRRCEVRVLEGEGHGLMASAAVMGAVLVEMSKEWEDWICATGADGRKDRDRARRAATATTTLAGRA